MFPSIPLSKTFSIVSLFIINRGSTHLQLADFFSGTWASGSLKSYTDRKGNTSMAERHVASQPLVFKESSSDDPSTAKKAVFNLRKMSELPYHLCNGTMKDCDRLKAEVLCNFDWLYEKLRAVGIMR